LPDAAEHVRLAFEAAGYGDLYMFDGAAMALAHDSRRASSYVAPGASPGRGVAQAGYPVA
jgi:hypothetical protein